MVLDEYRHLRVWRRRAKRCRDECVVQTGQSVAEVSSFGAKSIITELNAYAREGRQLSVTSILVAKSCRSSIWCSDMYTFQKNNPRVLIYILDIDFQSLIAKLVDMIQAAKDQDAMGSGLLCTYLKQYLWEST